MSNDVSVVVAVIAAILSAGGVLLATLTFVRGGFWNAKNELKELTGKLTSHDERLKAMETHVKNVPTAMQLGEVKHAIDMLGNTVTGRLDTMSATMHAADRERHALDKKVDRIEQHLLDQVKAG